MLNVNVNSNINNNNKGKINEGEKIDKIYLKNNSFFCCNFFQHQDTNIVRATFPILIFFDIILTSMVFF